jgi:hypothetical protein
MIFKRLFDVFRHRSDTAGADEGKLHPELLRAKSIARWMDTVYNIPFTKVKLGLDPLVGLLPFYIGDVLTLGLSLSIVWTGYRLGCPWPILTKMLVNIGIDLASGVIPLADALLDALWKANQRNIRLLEQAYRAEGHLWIPRSPTLQAKQTSASHYQTIIEIGKP